MNLRFVEAFYWVASLKSISRAAEKLFLTQSAMSSRITTLEEELGILLLDRAGKQFKLTAAGARFLVYAQKLLDLQREVKAEMGSGLPMTVAMRIGAIESVLHSWLIPWLEKLRADPVRDVRLMADWQSVGKPFEREYLQQLRGGGVERADPFMQEFRWLLEELRVMLFAQELRTPSPVSVKRLQKMWDGRRLG